MARIVYKAGYEGQNKLECIEGIEIELLNGQKALIYPKYAEKALLERKKVNEWRAPELSEIEALMRSCAEADTHDLIVLGSPAAEWVRQFRSDAVGTNFNLPTLLAAMEIQYQKKEIDALAEKIKGADLLRDYTSVVWACSKFKETLGWSVSGNVGYSAGSYIDSLYLSVPVIL